jgi:hypothetical protein
MGSLSSAGEKMIFKHCVFGVFNESQLNTFCMKYRRACESFRDCHDRVPRSGDGTIEE